ncbi:MAG: hypothetical protein AABY22_08855 [Nanoarchaeota archaeon]
MEGWNKWRGKKVYLILKNKRQYSGIIDEIILSSLITWITIKDKFGKYITFNVDEIELMQEEKR